MADGMKNRELSVTYVISNVDAVAPTTYSIDSGCHGSRESSGTCIRSRDVWRVDRQRGDDTG